MLPSDFDPLIAGLSLVLPLLIVFVVIGYFGNYIPRSASKCEVSGELYT